jgi:hypothetical protein
MEVLVTDVCWRAGQVKLGIGGRNRPQPGTKNIRGNVKSKRSGYGKLLPEYN